MKESQQDLEHVRTHKQCDICCTFFKPGEPLLTLFHDSEHGRYQVKAVGCFPGFESTHVRHLCLSSLCSECRYSPENATLHVDCFKLFTRHYPLPAARDLLWTVATWRRPWTGAPDLDIQSRSDCNDMELLARSCDIQKLLILPEELCKMVYDHLDGSLWDRYLRVEKFLQTISPKRGWTLSLINIRSWTRGGILETGSVQTHSLVQLTIDHRGLKSIGAYKKCSTLHDEECNGARYVVVKASDLADSSVEFKYGFARLQPSDLFETVPILDIPITPLQFCLCVPSALRSSNLILTTIQLRLCIGLTFFFGVESLFAVHAHTQSSPHALSTYKWLLPEEQHYAAWVYFPVSAEDRVTAVGIQFRVNTSSQNRSFLLQTSYWGDIAVGFQLHGEVQTISSEADATSLILVPKTSPISVLGMYPQKWKQSRSRFPFPLQRPLFRGTLFSEAPLDGVQHTSTFLNIETGFCIGVVLRYQNGAQRALGQCRFGIDRVCYCKGPAYIIYAPSTYLSEKLDTELRAVRVQFEQACADVVEAGWMRSEMKGTIRMWFNARQTTLEIVGGDEF